jgi:flagellar hook-basal body complex protein FliE
MPIDPSMAVTGPEWMIEPIAPPTQAPQSPSGAGFGGMLAEQISALEASQALATGQTNDVNSVVSQLEKAKLSMELASQIRTKGTEAYQEIFRTQV